MHKEKDCESADCVSEKKWGRTELVSATDEQFVTCSEIRYTLVLLLERRVERWHGDLVQE